MSEAERAFHEAIESHAALVARFERLLEARYRLRLPILLSPVLEAELDASRARLRAAKLAHDAEQCRL